ncbi:MAG: KpsF/GutQ family sugar-phosphate isomerase [Ginsengibacter sp.]
MTSEEILSVASRTFLQEANAIKYLIPNLDENFVQAIQAITDCKGRLVVSGIGKSAIIAQKIVATLNSTGTPSLFMHAADAIHGDIGMVQQKDIVMIISKSGDSPEIKVLVPLVRNFGNIVISMVGNVKSFLATQSTYCLNTTVLEEACPNNLAPTTSTTAQMVMGDALAICLMEYRGFNSDDFAKFHPGGTLGKKLYLRVSDLSAQNERPFVKPDSFLKEIIIEITKKRLGITAVINDKQKVVGIITDGDLRRMLERTTNLNDITAESIMSKNPKTILANELAVDALDIMRKNNITQLLVTKNDTYSGIIHIHDIIKEGII